MRIVAWLMLFVVISTSLPSSGVPAASATPCRMWVVHGRAGVDVVSEWPEEGKWKERCLSPFGKLQPHGFNDFKGLLNNRPKLHSAGLRGGELTRLYALRIPIES